MSQHTFDVWLLQDFSGGFGSATNTVGSGSVGSTTLSASAVQIEITVNDDDDDLLLEDSSAGEGGGSGLLQTLVDPITIETSQGVFVTYPAGSTVQLEYVANVDDGTEMLVIRLGPIGNSVNGDNVLVFYPEGVPGDTYQIDSISDEQARPYDTLCFARGTQIALKDGECSIETIKIGDLVKTKSGKLATVRWIGKSTLSAAKLAHFPHLRPVRIQSGALGNNLPKQDLIVSQQHRIYLDDWRVELLFGFIDFLAPAKALLNDSTIKLEAMNDGVEYFHIMFDQHEIISANGQLTESFYPGKQAIKTLDQAAQQELFEIFPELSGTSNIDYPMAAPCLKPFEMAAIKAI